MEKEASFFERLTFDPALNQSLIARYFRSIRTIVLIVFTLFVGGLAAFFTLPRELNPDIQIPIVFVSTAYPGAGPEDIETLVTVPLEDAVLGLTGVTRVTSSSQEGFSTLTVEFASGTHPQTAKTEVQNAVDSVTDLPQEAEASHAQVLDFQEQPVLTFLMSSTGDPESLSRFAEVLDDRLNDLPEIEKTSLSYQKDSEVSLFLRPEALKEKNLTLTALSQAVASALGNYPGGSVESGATTLALTQAPLIREVADLRNLPINIDNQVVALGEVAVVRESESPNAARAYYADPETPQTRAVFFAVFNREGVDAEVAVGQVEKEITALREQYAQGAERFIYEPIFNGAREIEKTFDQLFHDFLLTIFFVFLVLLIFFGLRQSVIASLAIPFTFLGVFLIMQATGVSINFIALFSLLIALGILVDNAIVIISAMASYDRTGKFSPDQTALLVYRDFRSVIFTTTVTTVWAFFPLLLATGIIGEFIRPIPILVSASLAISAAIALFIVTPLMALFMKGRFPRRVVLTFYLVLFLLLGALLFIALPAGPWKLGLFSLALIVLLLFVWLARNVPREKIVLPPRLRSFFQKTIHLSRHGLFDFEPLSHRYARLITRILRSRRARRQTFAMLVIFSLFSYALVPAGLVVNEFFPEDDIEIVYAHLKLAPGATLAQAEQEVPPLLERLRSYPDTRFVFAEIGAAPPTDSFVSAGSGYHSILFTLLLVAEEEREKTSGEVVAALNRELGNYARGEFAASQLSGGPPAGSDIELKLLGEDLPTLERYAREIENYLKAEPGVTNTSLSIEGGLSKIVFVPRETDLARFHMTEDETALLLRTLGGGLTIKEDARFRDNGKEEERDVVLRLGDESGTLNTSQDLPLLSTAQARGSLPFLSLGDFVLEPNPPLITREDGKRTIAVRAGVLEGYSVTTVNGALEKFADTLELPAGYSWQTGGVNEENDKSVRSIMLAMLLSAILIFGTMAIQFNSFRQALAALLVIPLAVSGVFVVFGLLGIPLSFPALIGVLALFGIVVNNSIIMVDKMNRNMQSGLPLIQAISEGAASRLEPILLTALSTIVGLIPITLSDPIWRGLGGAIIAGLLFSGIVKLFFLPLIYYAFFGPKEKEGGAL